MLELLKPKQHSVLFLFYPNPWTTYRERTRIGGNTHKFIAPQLLYSAIPELLLITIGSKRCPIGTIRSFNTRGIGPNSIFLKVCGLWGGKLWRICPPPPNFSFSPNGRERQLFHWFYRIWVSSDIFREPFLGTEGTFQCAPLFADTEIVTK